jgi:hypothetical protein
MVNKQSDSEVDELVNLQETDINVYISDVANRIF